MLRDKCMPEPLRIMALDLGERRVGVALSDETRTLATPFTVLQRKSFNGLLEDLDQIIKQEAVSVVIVGFPQSLDGTIGPQAKHVADEAERIKSHIGLPVALWDERLTTVRATQMLRERRPRRPQRRPTQTLDAMVAAMILQEYLDAAHDAETTSPEE
jgi:putative pre-16S rRNA nuclease